MEYGVRRPRHSLYLPSPLLTKEGKEKAEIFNELVDIYNPRPFFVTR